MIDSSDYDSEIKTMAKLCKKKNSDYSNSEDFLKNFRRAENLGLTPLMGVVVRMEDKMSRIENLIKKREASVEDESLEDAFRDLANYAIIAILCLMEDRENISILTSGKKED